MRTLWISLIFLLSLGIGSCGVSQAGTEQASEWPSAETAAIAETQTIPAMPTPFDDMPKDPPLPIPANPGLQALIENAKADLAQKLSITASQIKAIETKEVFWPDASLGCPQPGIVYAQIPTPGYLIMLVYGEKEFEYHASIHGDTLYCENPTPPILGSPTDLDPFRMPPP